MCMQDNKLPLRGNNRRAEALTFTSNSGPIGSAMDPFTKVKCPVIDPVLSRVRLVQL